MSILTKKLAVIFIPFVINSLIKLSSSESEREILA